QEREVELQTLRRAVEEAGQAIFITDDDGTIEYVNPAFERITGYSSDEAVGQNPKILQSGELDEQYYERMWEAILDGELWQEEIPNRRKSGELYYAHQTIAPITQNGDLTKFVAIQHEITERKEREQHLEALNRVLRHNHRNLLNTIMGTSNSLSTSSHEDSKLVGMIQETSAELHELSEKAHTLTQLLVNDQRRVCISNLGDEVDSVVSEFESRHQDADIILNAEVDIPISAHPHFTRAIRELVENAIKHAGSKEVSIQI
ncbi:MAG: PAS domain S-box protein, partial [Halobacteriaceae archaeon]